MEDFGGGGSSIFGACAMSNRIPSAVEPRLISDDRALAPVPGRLSPVPGRLPPVPGRKKESSARKSEGGGGFWNGSQARSSDKTGENFSAFTGAGAFRAFRAAASKACCLSIAPVWTSTSEYAIEQTQLRRQQRDDGDFHTGSHPTLSSPSSS